MYVYHILLRIFPPIVAKILTSLWFSVLITAVLFFSLEPQISFKYGNL